MIKLKSTQGFCSELAKRARQGRVLALALALTATTSYIVYTQGSGTPSTLRIKTDANGYLIATSIAQTNPVTTSVFFNTRLKTDSNGYLLIVVTGAIFPTTISCNGSIGTTLSVLMGGNPCSWSATPSITSVSVGDGTGASPAIKITSTGAGFYKDLLWLGDIAYANGNGGRFTIAGQDSTGLSTSARPALVIFPDTTLTRSFQLNANGPSTTNTNHSNIPLSTFISSNSGMTGGLSLGTSDANGIIRFFTAGPGFTNLRWSIDISGNFLGAANAGHISLNTAAGSGGSYIEGWEQSSDPSAPATNSGRLFFKDNGAGKTQACVRFPTGATQCFATEP